MNTESKKTEKLVSALYLLTSFFVDLEPLKWRLRELGGKLIAGKENRNIVLEILGLLNVSKNAGLVSDMNFEIIHREFNKLLPQTESLNEIFKNIDEKPPYSAIADTSAEVVSRQPVYLSSTISQGQNIKDRIPKKNTDKDGAVALKKNSRQAIILNLIKRKKEVMIKDVSPLINGISEKTIQRELLSLVKAGILRKMGEKRWSRYSLATS